MAWKRSLPKEQHEWIGHSLFRHQDDKAVLTDNLQMWWYPPQPCLQYHQPPASPDCSSPGRCVCRCPTGCGVLWDLLQDSDAGAEFAWLVFPGNRVPGVPALQQEACHVVLRLPGPAGSGSPHNVPSYPHFPVSLDIFFIIIIKN